MAEHAASASGPGPFARRRARLRARMAAADLDALLVTHPPNVRYLSGFSGSYGALLVLGDRDVLLSDGRYQQQAATEAPGVEVALAPGDPVAGAAKVLGGSPGMVGFEPSGLTWAAGHSLLELVPSARPAPPLVETLREVKDDVEVACMRAAAEAGTATFAEVLGELRPGITERELAWWLEAGLRRNGGDGLAFDPIVAFGEQAAEPHHHPNERPLARGDLVKLDFGASVEGYRSDMTRTVVLGPASGRQRELYELVRLAQAAGLATLRPGVSGDEVDRACRDVIAAADLAASFSHPTGHGVGLEIHEAPRVRAGAGDSIAAGTPLTVEPGVYIPGFGGVRIEDLVIVRPGGHELLTTATKDLLVL
jgi:Xaa-Pro aminopeptidase